MPPALDLSKDDLDQLRIQLERNRVAAETERSHWVRSLPMWRRLANGEPANPRTLPWDGAADVNMEIIGDNVDEMHARIMSTLFGDMKWAPVEPGNDAAEYDWQRTENFMQWGLQSDIGIRGTISASTREVLTVGNAFIYTDWEKKLRTTREVRYISGTTASNTDILNEVFRDTKQATEKQEDGSWRVRLKEAGRSHTATVYITKAPMGREDETEVTIDRQTYVRNCPHPRLLDPAQVYFADVGNLAWSPYLHVEFKVSPDWIKGQWRQGKFKLLTPTVMTEIEESQTQANIESSKRDTGSEKEKDAQAGVDTYNQRAGLRPFVVACEEWDYDGDGLKEDVVVYYDWHLKRILDVVPLQEAFPSGHRPVTELKIREVPNRTYSFGLPRLLMNSQMIVNTMLNQALDAQTLRNMPFFFYNYQLFGNDLGNRHRIGIQPGYGVAVSGDPQDGILPVTLGGDKIDGLMPFVSEMISYMDRRAGKNSAMNANMAGSGRAGGMPRTFGATNIVHQESLIRIEEMIATFAHGGQGNSGGLNELYHQIHDLYAVNLPTDIKFQVTGSNEPMVISRQDLQYRPKFRFSVNQLTANAAVRRADEQMKFITVGPQLVQLGAHQQWIEQLRRFHQAYNTPNMEEVIPELPNTLKRAPMTPEQIIRLTIEGVPVDPLPVEDAATTVQAMQEFYTQYVDDILPERWNEFIRTLGLYVQQLQAQEQAGATQFNTGGRPMGGERRMPGQPQPVRPAQGGTFGV